MHRWLLKPARDIHLSERERLASYDREGGFLSDSVRLLWWTAVRTMLAVWHRFQTSGTEHLPESPSYVLVANHSSHLDALAIASALPLRLRNHIFPLAAGEVFFETPRASAFSAFCLNALPLWRKNCGRHSLEQLQRRLLNEPTVYILFPEGTRSRDGNLQTFKPGVGMLLAGTSIPVIPCHLAGAFEALPPGRSLPRPSTIRLAMGPPIQFDQVANDRDGWVRIAAALEEQVRALSEATDSLTPGNTK